MSRQRSEDLATRTDQVSLKPYDRAQAITRPADLGPTYAEHEYHALSEQQLALWPAEGDRAGREIAARAAWHQPHADATTTALTHSEALLAGATERYQRAVEVLGPWRRRASNDNIRYLTVMALLALGDTAGIWASAVWLGEIPLIALGQAVATGAAAVTAGLAGGELRTAASARSRRRDREELDAGQQQFARLFSAADGEHFAGRVIGLLSACVVLLIALGIFALRTGVEGSLAGLTFGGLAAATALASFISCYVHADDVADLIGTYAKERRKAEKHHMKVAGTKSLAITSADASRVGSIVQENDRRALGAAYEVDALKHRMLRQNPQVVGHGFAATTPDPVGRRVRDHGDQL